MNRTMYDLIGLAAGVCFILALKGLSHPKTARRGNLIGALGATIATLVVFAYNAPLNNLGWIIGAIAVGSLIGVPAARRVQMTQMPQLLRYLTVLVAVPQRSLQLWNISPLAMALQLQLLSLPSSP